MKLRDVIIGAVATLLVTFLAGVGVFYATKEPEEKKNEKLVYSFNQSAQFSGELQDVAFSSLSISNIGGVTAKNVSIFISLNTSEIKDLVVSAGKGLREVTRERTPKSVRLVYERLLPQEQITINLLLTKKEEALIDVRSDVALGTPRNSTEGDQHKKSINETLGGIAQKIGFLSGGLLILGLVFLKRRGLLSRKDQNDTGFLLLHNGLTHEAESTLQAAVRNGRFDQLHTI